VAVNLISCDSGVDRIYIHDGISSTILSSFATPSTYPTGLAFDGTNLISCDRDADKIYIHDGISSTILSSFASPGGIPKGLAFDGTNLISSDSEADKIYIHDGISSTILSSFASPGDYPTDLTFDGTNLISGDNIDAFTSGISKIYVHDGISSTILYSFPSPGKSPAGLVFDGTNLISSDSEADKIYIHDGISSTILSSFASPGGSPGGLEIVPPVKPSLPTDLKCEGATNPTAVADTTPEFTAVYSHPYGHLAEYYRIQISRTPSFSDIVWDSGKTKLPSKISKGKQCQPIECKVTLPLDGSTYYWRIKFWDEAGEESDWSVE